MIEQPPDAVAPNSAGGLLEKAIAMVPSARCPLLEYLANALEYECSPLGLLPDGTPAPHATVGTFLAGATTLCRFVILINKSSAVVWYRASTMHPDQWNALPAGKRVAILNEQPFVLEWKATEPAKVFCRWVP